MAGLDKNMLNLIECLAKNRIQDAKKAAIVCCKNDTTRKNERDVAYYLKLMAKDNKSTIELPATLQGILKIQDMSAFNTKRYYVGKQQKELYEKICIGNQVYAEMMAYGFPYTNSTLIYGEPGTGKTEFAKYVAHQLDLPYVYINFSYLIDSYMGNTSKNLQKTFDHCKGMQCVLTLDEIDCIGLKRGNSSAGCDGELARTTISLLQCLDDLADGQIVIAATNRGDRLDPALLRRFRHKAKFTRYNMEEELDMITKIIDSIDILEMDQNIIDYSAENHTQAETINHLTELSGEKVMERIRNNEE